MRSLRSHTEYQRCNQSLASGLDLHRNPRAAEWPRPRCHAGCGDRELAMSPQNLSGCRESEWGARSLLTERAESRVWGTGAHRRGGRAECRRPGDAKEGTHLGVASPRPAIKNQVKGVGEGAQRHSTGKCKVVSSKPATKTNKYMVFKKKKKKNKWSGVNHVT